MLDKPTGKLEVTGQEVTLDSQITVSLHYNNRYIRERRRYTQSHIIQQREKNIYIYTITPWGGCKGSVSNSLIDVMMMNDDDDDVVIFFLFSCLWS